MRQICIKTKLIGQFFSLFMSLICLISTTSFSQTDLWQVGIARVDITPSDTLWLAGYGFRSHAATGTLHQLWAKAIAFQDEQQHRGVLVTADLLGFPKGLSDSIRRRLHELYGLENAQIILNSSHTHCGPVLENSLSDVYPLKSNHVKMIEQYSHWLEEQILTTVGAALENTRPARLYYGNGAVRFQVNRRNNNANTLSEQSDLNGPNDYAVPVLMAKGPDGELIAVVFGYACHPTVLNIYEWSGDYPGVAQTELEKRNPGAMALFFQGCGADQNPLPRRAVSLAQQYGEELAAAVTQVLHDTGQPLKSELVSGYTEIDLAFTTPPTIAEFRAFVDQATGYPKRWATRLLKQLEKNQPLPDSYPYPIQAWRLGTLPIFALGGEVVIDYAIALKRIFGQETFVMGYSNDLMGYIPSTRVLREGGYEGNSSQVVYGLPSTWASDIEIRILGAATLLGKKIGLRFLESKIALP